MPRYTGGTCPTARQDKWSGHLGVSVSSFRTQRKLASPSPTQFYYVLGIPASITTLMGCSNGTGEI